MITYLYLVRSDMSVYAINSSGVLHFIAFSSISFVISFLSIGIIKSPSNQDSAFHSRTTSRSSFSIASPTS